MANSTTNLDLISVNDSQKEVRVNAMLDAGSPATVYGRRAQTSGGLVWGFFGGAVMVAGVPTQVANGTLTLTASTTNYLEADPTTGAVSFNTTGFTAGSTRLYTVVAGTSTVTSYTDQRVGVLSAGAGVTSVNGYAGAVTLTATDVGAEASGTASAAITAHEAASDPHPQYLTQTEADARYAATASAGVTSVNGHTGAVTLAASDVGADSAGAASSALVAHVAASDPHAQYALESTIGQANGIAGLGSDGKLPASQLPNLAIIDFLGTVADQAAMLALSGQKGDWCARSDNSKVYVITGTDPTQATSWTSLSYPTGTGGTVTSVALTTPGLLFDVTGSPITSTGTLGMTLKTQVKNTFLAGPASGADAAPTMRALTAADLPAQPFDVMAFYPGVPSASSIVTRVPVARAVSFPAGLVGSIGKASVAATASVAFDVQRNGASVGTITFGAGSASATFTAASAITLAAGDIISIIAPATVDATLSNVGFVLAGTR